MRKGKTNKALFKRVRITKKGKVLARKSGQNHFNAKESGKVKLNKKRIIKFQIKKKTLKDFLPF